MTDNNQSPCKTCERKDEDKRGCSKICDRLNAWQDEDPKWDTFRTPTPEELGEVDESGKKICKHDGCDAPAKCRGFCLQHYDLWRQRKLPGYPPFEAIRARKPKRAAPKNDRKKATAKNPTRQRKSVRPKTVTDPAKVQFNVDLTRYPGLRLTVVSMAAQFCVPPEHIIISLIGEGLAARQQGAL